MKKILVIILILVAMAGSFFAGGWSVLHSEGWVDEDRGEFVVEWLDNIWTWGISHG